MRSRLRSAAPAAALLLWPVLGAPLAAQGAGPWEFRLRGIAVVPDESAQIDPIGGDAEIDEAYVPELDISYFFTDRVALELILATAEHDVRATGTSLGEVDLGSVWLLPPTLVLQLHPLPEAPVRPYVGAGGNLTIFYNEEVPGDPVSEADYDTAVGAAFQAGVDIPIGTAGWRINLDVKKLFLETDVTLNGGDVEAQVDIDPWIFGAGVGIRLGG